jgi:hypothetical protein
MYRVVVAIVLAQVGSRSKIFTFTKTYNSLIPTLGEAIAVLLIPKYSIASLLCRNTEH